MICPSILAGLDKSKIGNWKWPIVTLCKGGNNLFVFFEYREVWKFSFQTSSNYLSFECSKCGVFGSPNIKNTTCFLQDDLVKWTDFESALLFPVLLPFSQPPRCAD